MGLVRARKRLCQSTFPTFLSAHTLTNWEFTLTRVPSGMVTSAMNLLESPGISESENADADGDTDGVDDAATAPESSRDDRPRTMMPRTATIATTRTTAAAASHGSRCRRAPVTSSSVGG